MIKIINTYQPQHQNIEKEHIELVDSISRLIDYKNDYQAFSSTATGVVEHGDWAIHNLELINTKSDYFRISLYDAGRNTMQFLITQQQQALVMLLVAEIEGVLCALLNTRYEPGLIDSCNYTTTIQSTPSNYLRQHDGKETPFLDFAMNPKAHGCVLLDTENYDWGDFYVSKKKRFLIIKINQAIRTPPGFFWVSKDTLKMMATKDHLITNDLRVCIPLLSMNLPVSTLSQVQVTESYKEITKLPFDFETQDTAGAHIKFFRTQSTVREVAAWTQPLLASCQPKKIKLTFKEDSGSRLYAIVHKSQFGLLGNRVWFPVEVANAKPYHSVLTCAEGGRFWRLLIHIQLSRLEEASGAGTDMESGIFWFSEQQILSMIASPLETSLELRMAFSLI